MPRILVVGSINTDLVLEVDRLPNRGENLIGERHSYLSGGKGANQAIAAARLGAEVALVGRVGKDSQGDTLRAELEREGIDTRWVTSTTSAPTGLAVITVERHGENRIIVYPGANMTLDASCVLEALTETFDAVMLQLEVPDEVVVAVCSAAREKGIPVVLDAGPARSFDLSLVHGIAILTPNQTEALALTGLPCDSIERAEVAARALYASSGARFVVVKMGELGALVLAEGSATHVPAFAVEAVDPTAAGDAFTAALLVRWLATGNILDAARYGNAAGSLAASKLGAQQSLPHRAAVDLLGGRLDQ
jgi:ribokinase